MADIEDAIRELVKYILKSKKDHYIVACCNNFNHLMQDDQDETQALEQDFIEKNLDIIKHIYMYARIVEAAYGQK